MRGSHSIILRQVLAAILAPLAMGLGVASSSFGKTLSVPPTQYYLIALYSSGDPSSPCYGNSNSKLPVPECTDFSNAPGSVSEGSVASASLNGGIDPTMSASAVGFVTGSPTTTYAGESGAGETLYFAINPGPGVGNQNVTEAEVDISGEGSWTGNAGWEIAVSDYTTGTGTSLDCEPTSSTCMKTGYLSIGDVYELIISASANGYPRLGGVGDFSSSASVDPVVSLNPAFLAAHPGFSLTFGANTFPATVPEPSTWAMLALGFAGLAFARSQSARRLRRA